MKLNPKRKILSVADRQKAVKELEQKQAEVDAALARLNDARIEIAEATERAKAEASEQAMSVMLHIFLYVLKDKFGWSDSRVSLAAKRINRTAEFLADGTITMDDVKAVLKEEYDCEVRIS